MRSRKQKDKWLTMTTFTISRMNTHTSTEFVTSDLTACLTAS